MNFVLFMDLEKLDILCFSFTFPCLVGSGYYQMVNGGYRSKPILVFADGGLPLKD